VTTLPQPYTASLTSRPNGPMPTASGEGREQAAQAIETDDGFEHCCDQGYAARVARDGTGDALRAADAAWFSVWLHGDRRWAIKRMRNLQEGRHGLAKYVVHGRRGELRAPRTTPGWRTSSAPSDW
jgi:hypothetical protein